MVKRVHFICRGNSFRSRLAESYLKSLKLPGVVVLSSGTVAKEHSAENGSLPPFTKHALLAHGLLAYDKGHWDQLTAARVAVDDITIFFGQLAYQEAKANNLVVKNSRVWDIPDTGELFEGSLTPSHNDPGVDEFAEKTYQRIKERIDDTLVGELR
jgi:protein-tyrosine-phosphatase